MSTPMVYRDGRGRLVSNLTGHTQGVEYYSSYWRKRYRVAEVHLDGQVTCTWEDGGVTTHSTKIGKDQRVR